MSGPPDPEHHSPSGLPENNHHHSSEHLSTNHQQQLPIRESSITDTEYHSHADFANEQCSTSHHPPNLYSALYRQLPSNSRTSTTSNDQLHKTHPQNFQVSDLGQETQLSESPNYRDPDYWILLDSEYNTTTPHSRPSNTQGRRNDKMPLSEESWASDGLQEGPVFVGEKRQKYVPAMGTGSQQSYVAGEKRLRDPSDIDNIPNKRHRGENSTDAPRSFPEPRSATQREYVEEADDGYYRDTGGRSQNIGLGISYLPEHQNGSNPRQVSMESQAPYNTSTPQNRNTQDSLDFAPHFGHSSGGSSQRFDFRSEILPPRSQNSFEREHSSRALHHRARSDEYFDMSPPCQRISMESLAPLYQRNGRLMGPETQWNYDEERVDRRQRLRGKHQGSSRQHQATGRNTDPEMRSRLNEERIDRQQVPMGSYHTNNRQCQNIGQGMAPKMQWKIEDEEIGPYRRGPGSYEDLRSGYQMSSQFGGPGRNVARPFINPDHESRSESKSRTSDMCPPGPSHSRSNSFASIDRLHMGPRSEENHQNLTSQNEPLLKDSRIEEMTILPRTPPRNESQGQFLPPDHNSRESCRYESPYSPVQQSARSNSFAPIDRARPNPTSIRGYPPPVMSSHQETEARDDSTTPKTPPNPPLRGQFFNVSGAPHNLDFRSQGCVPDLLRQWGKESDLDDHIYDDMTRGNNAARSPCPTIDLREYFKMSRKTQQSQVRVDNSPYLASKVLPAESIRFGERVKTPETPIRNQQHLMRGSQESPVDLLTPPAKAVIKSIPMKERITPAQSKAILKKRQTKRAADSEPEERVILKKKAAAKKAGGIRKPKPLPKTKKAPLKKAVDLELEKQQRAAQMIVNQEQKAELEEVERMIFGEIIGNDLEDDEAVNELQRQKREERMKAELKKEELREAAEREKVAIQEWEAEQAAKRKVVEEQASQAKKARWEARRKELHVIEEERKEENRRKAQEQIEALRQNERDKREAKEREKQKAIEIQNEARKLAAAEIEKVKKEVAKLQAASLKPATKHSNELKKYSEAPQKLAEDENSLFVSQSNSTNGDASDVYDVDQRNRAKSIGPATTETSRKSFQEARAELEAQQKAEAEKTRAEDLKARLEARNTPKPATKLPPSRKPQSNQTENLSEKVIYPASELKEIIATFPATQKSKATVAAPSPTLKLDQVEELSRNTLESPASIGSPITPKPNAVANVLELNVLESPQSNVSPDSLKPKVAIIEALSNNAPKSQSFNRSLPPAIGAQPNENPSHVPKPRTRKLCAECRSCTVRPGSQSCDQCSSKGVEPTPPGQSQRQQSDHSSSQVPRPRTNKACTECRGGNWQCAFKSESQICERCGLKGIPCVPQAGPAPWGPEYYISSTSCRRIERGCSFQSGSQACENCVSRTIPCVPELKVDAPQEKPHNTPQAKLRPLPLELPPPQPPPSRTYPSTVKTITDVQREKIEAQIEVAKQKAALAKQREAFEKRQQRWKNDEERYAKNQRARILIEAKEKGVAISETEVWKRVEGKLKIRKENYQRKIAKQKAELGLGVASSGTVSQPQCFSQTQSQSSGEYGNDDFEQESTPPQIQLTEPDAGLDAAHGAGADPPLTEEDKTRKESAEDMKRALRALGARNGSRFAQAAAKRSVAHFQEDSEESEEDPDEPASSRKRNQNADQSEESESDEGGIDDTNSRRKKGKAVNGLNPDDFGTQIDNLFDTETADTPNDGHVAEEAAPAQPLINRMIRLYIVQHTNVVDGEEQATKILQKFTNRDDANSFAGSIFQEFKDNKAESKAIAEEYKNKLFHGSLTSEENGETSSTTLKVTTEIIQDSSTLATFDPEMIQPRILEFTYFIKFKTSTAIKDEETNTTTITNKEEILPPPHHYSDLELANYAAMSYFYTYLKPPRAKIDWIAQHENDLGKQLREARDDACRNANPFGAEIENFEGQAEWLEEKIVGVEVVRYEVKGPLN